MTHGHWEISTKVCTGHFTCVGCGPHRAATGKPFMQAMGRWGFIELCLSCAAELRDAFLHVTEQRSSEAPRVDQPKEEP